MFGLPAIANDLAQLVRGRAEVLPGCATGSGSPRAAAPAAIPTARRTFAADVERHLTGRPCVHMGRSHVPLESR